MVFLAFYDSAVNIEAIKIQNNIPTCVNRQWCLLWWRNDKQCVMPSLICFLGVYISSLEF